LASGHSFNTSMKDALRWVYWWHSTEATPEDVMAE
jgi:hypothetical protein